MERWLRLMRLGFSLALRGVGSKWELLETFADSVLLPWGATVVRFPGFNTRLSLVECLHDVLTRLFPQAQCSSITAESLVHAIAAARRESAVPLRPLCLVVHNLELLPAARQQALATLAALPGVHLIASVDNMWASLAWSSRCLSDFNFCYEEVHTYKSYELEMSARYPGAPPGWCNPSSSQHKVPKASLALVLRSLTLNHRELVQAIAKHQLEGGGHTGISMCQLLAVATDQMIATTVPKLRILLNELQDHEIVTQKTASDGGHLFLLSCDAQTLKSVAGGESLEGSDDE